MSAVTTWVRRNAILGDTAGQGDQQEYATIVAIPAAAQSASAERDRTTIILERPNTSEEARKLRADLVGRAAELVPLLEKNATRTEDDRRIAGENIAAIEQAELFKIMQPKRFGGLEVEFRTTLEVTRELARGCGSTSWTTNLINIDAFVVGMCNEQMQQDVWSESPNNRVAGALGPTGTADVVDGGYRVSGRWQSCSGCLHAQWVLLGVAISDDDGEPVDQGIILAPISDVAIEDTWFVAGMRGTGSNTVVADAIFVPAHRYVSALKLQDGETDNPHKNEVLYRAPFAPGVTVIHAGPHLGLARAALDFVIDKATKRGIAYTFYDLQANAPTVQLAVARAASLIDTAELLSYRSAAEVDDAAHQNVLPDYLSRAKTRMDTVQAIVFAREAIRELISAHGASSFGESNPLQRIWRDSEVASRHALVNPAIGAEVYGRALLGFTQGVTPLV